MKIKETINKIVYFSREKTKLTEVMIYYSYKVIVAFGYLLFITSVNKISDNDYEEVSLGLALAIMTSVTAVTWLSQGMMKFGGKELKIGESNFLLLLVILLTSILTCQSKTLAWQILDALMIISLYVIAYAQLKNKLKMIVYSEVGKGLILTFFSILMMLNENLEKYIDFVTVLVIAHIPGMVIAFSVVKFHGVKIIKTKSLITVMKYGVGISIWILSYSYLPVLDRMVLSEFNGNYLYVYDIVSRIIPFLMAPISMMILRVYMESIRGGEENNDALVNKLVIKLIMIYAFGVVLVLFLSLVAKLQIDTMVVISILSVVFGWQLAVLIQKSVEVSGRMMLLALVMAVITLIYWVLYSNYIGNYLFLVFNIIAIILYIYAVNFIKNAKNI